MSENDLKNWLARANMLTESLPFMRRYNQKTVVIKYGGHAMGDLELANSFANDIVLLKQCGVHPIIVHGGGPQINAMLDRLDIKSNFQDGLRYTDPKTMDIVEMVLAGSINKQIVASINKAGGYAIGISGKDCRLIKAKKLTTQTTSIDLGFVGIPEVVDTQILEIIANSNIIPIIAPIGFDDDGNTYNINSDTVAGEIAIAVKAKRLLMLTDVDGIQDLNGNLLSEISLRQIDSLIADKVITGGMIPKIQTCKAAVEQNVEGAVILNGKHMHSILLELFSPLGFGSRVSSTTSSQV